MIKGRMILVSMAGVVALSAGAVGVASAATTSTTKTNAGNVGSSDIPRSVFKTERQAAAAKVLNVSVADLQAAHKNKTFADLLSKAGLTKQTFREKLKAELTSDLEAKGYSQDQITIALQHREIVRMHHHEKKAKATSSTTN